MTSHALLRDARELLHRQFGKTPRYEVFAPGRVNLIGEHTDYNEGLALPLALDLGTAIAVSPRADGEVVATSLSDGLLHHEQFSIRAPPEPGPRGWWGNYLRGMCSEMIGHGIQVRGADLAIVGDIPSGAGLSSSASLSIAVGRALLENSMPTAAIDASTLAHWGQSTEHRYAGCLCGIMDQMTVAHASPGEVVFLDFKDLSIERYRLPSSWTILIAQSGIRRELAAGEYNVRRRQCREAADFYGVDSLRDLDMQRLDTLPPPQDASLIRRSRHVVTENSRVERAAESMKRGDLKTFGRLLRQSHASLRHDFEVTIPEVDELADKINALIDQQAGGEGGARMTGGGFGGCLVAAVPSDAADQFQRLITEESGRPVWRQQGRSYSST
jgi:galactokinase